MTIHEMKLHDEPFSAIASGAKTIEMRLLDDKRRRIGVGDAIRFVHTESGERMMTTVLALHAFPDFDALYRALLPRVGAVGLGYAPGEIASPTDMLDYYSAEEIARYGVVGIEIRLEQKNDK